ncbi:putative phage abortive infection protein [Leptospira paudalimensis]|uniref:Phage abortive infection protein n=1 Tax=Leptospira paudalimensis TaxID=2950024 RepID=A0ABT3M558_9LEPT|nr:putative phage abortive infection protein [Leptospira paudalimensis]MCW7503525.1 putative phage abortive infection protein [Leptospira paudalimensis]
MKNKILNFLAIFSFFLGIVLVIILLIQIYLSGYRINIQYINLDNSNKIATIFQGIVGTAWLVTTITLLFLTIEIQKKELRETSNSLRQQNEDSHFFSLLNTFNAIRNQIELSITYYQSINSLNSGEYKESKYRGNRYFENIFSWFIMFSEVVNPKIKDQLKISNNLNQLNLVFGLNNEQINLFKELIIFDNSWGFYGSVFSAYFGLLSSDLGNYYNLLTQIIKFTERSLSKEIYINYIKSVLSRDEISLFYYYGITNFELRKFLEKTKFFDQVDNIDLIEKEHQNFYKTA